MQESTESNTEVYCAPIPLPSVRQNRADHLGFLWFNLLEKVLEKGFFGQWGWGDGPLPSVRQIEPAVWLISNCFSSEYFFLHILKLEKGFFEARYASGRLYSAKEPIPPPPLAKKSLF